MKTLTAKEEEIMGFFWENGPLFVKQMLEFYDEPRPHFNTVSTFVRMLEEKGYVSHRVLCGIDERRFQEENTERSHQQIFR